MSEPRMPMEPTTSDFSDYSVETRGLNLWYGAFQALVNVNIDVRHGRITALIGPSGCGKTTLLRALNRINERLGNVTTAGEVRVFGQNIYAPEVSLPVLRRTVGMVFQRPNPLPIPIYENVVLGLRLHHRRAQLRRTQLDDAVEKALREVFLWDDVKNSLHRRATELILEQQQKLCIARLLPLKPKVILMDEPCSALDIEGTRAIEDMMLGLRDRYTIVIVTHNMAQARRVSDECIYMLLGEIIEHAATEHIFLNPRDTRTADYIEGRYG